MNGQRPHAGRSWLANYYLRGVIALIAAFVALALGADDGMPLIIGAGVWVALFLAAKVAEGYADPAGKKSAQTDATLPKA